MDKTTTSDDAHFHLALPLASFMPKYSCHLPTSPSQSMVERRVGWKFTKYVDDGYSLRVRSLIRQIISRENCKKYIPNFVSVYRQGEDDKCVMIDK